MILAICIILWAGFSDRHRAGRRQTSCGDDVFEARGQKPCRKAMVIRFKDDFDDVPNIDKVAKWRMEFVAK
jgi:hypothetical protein